MKKIALLITALVFVLGTTAQDNHQCGTDYYWQKKYGETVPNWEDQLHERMIRTRSGEASGDRATIIIPVVVHVIHDGEESNISHEQVESGIQMLNEDYTRTNADTSDTRNTGEAPFEPIAANADIEFRLAKLDEYGDCTNGVERRYSPSSTVNADDAVKHWTTGGLDAWNRYNYFNIWVVESIDSDGGGTTLGYAYLPYFGTDSDFGVLIRHDVFGNIGTAGGDRTLTHEVGHSLGLLHTFQGSCHSDACDENGDYCCDTPPVVDPQWSCSTSQNTCTGVPSGDFYGFDAYDQFENFMSYSPCQNMFSTDQSDIMNFNLSDISMFVSLTSSTNLTNTGVGLPDVLCEAEFAYDQETVCAGSSVAFIDMSYANVTEWNWSFPGGTPSSSTDQNPVVTYNTGGVHSVTLEVSDGTDFVETTKTDIITVLSDPGDPLPYHEGFETLAEVPDNLRFLTTNEDEGQEWNLYNGTGSSGENCVKLKNFGLGNGSVDELISGPIDLSGVSSSDEIFFNFKYAYKRRSSSNQERLRFYISKDCGETWILRKQLEGEDLGPEVHSSSYTPEDISEWIPVDIDNITETYHVSNFMYKFEFTNDQGNNIYIDDINLYPASMVGMKDDQLTDLSVYPNPVDDLLEIQFGLEGVGQASITLHNALGQKVGTIFEGILSGESSKITYEMDDIPSGVYYVNLAYGESTKSVKVIKM